MDKVAKITQNDVYKQLKAAKLVCDQTLDFSISFDKNSIHCPVIKTIIRYKDLQADPSFDSKHVIASIVVFPDVSEEEYDSIIRASHKKTTTAFGAKLHAAIALLPCDGILVSADYDLMGSDIIPDSIRSAIEKIQAHDYSTRFVTESGHSVESSAITALAADGNPVIYSQDWKIIGRHPEQNGKRLHYYDLEQPGSSGQSTGPYSGLTKTELAKTGTSEPDWF